MFHSSIITKLSSLDSLVVNLGKHIFVYHKFQFLWLLHLALSTIEGNMKAYFQQSQSNDSYQLLHQYHKILLFEENELASSPLILHKANILVY